MTMKMKLRTVIVLWCLGAALPLQAQALRPISGVVVTSKDEAVYGVTVIASSNIGEQRTVTDNDGRFQLDVPSQEVTLRFEGKNIRPQERTIGLNEATVLRVEIEFLMPPIHQSMVIVASALEPSVETHSDEVYKKTLFSRDDQLIETLNAGINAGQHEGGGKSLEIRRFGFNLDHGGVNGGLKVMVDGVQQNQGTQGHGQGYLGALKALSPELIEDVTITNGPFSAEYGDFSGLGVVHIHQRESLPEQYTVRLQGGNFNTGRGFFAFSPDVQHIDAYLAYEGSYTDGAFQNPGRYRRDNLNGNYTRTLGEGEKV